MKDERIYDPVLEKILYGYYFPTCPTGEADTTAAEIIEMMFEDNQRELCEIIAKNRGIPVDWDNDDFDSEFFGVCKYVALKWRYIESNIGKIVAESSADLSMGRQDFKAIELMLLSVIDYATGKGYTELVDLINEKCKNILTSE